jgi:hypothetical protein
MLDRLQLGFPNFLNMFLDALWQDPIIRTRARELLINNVAIQAAMQDLLQNQYPGFDQRQRAEQSSQSPFGDAAHSDLAANFPSPKPPRKQLHAFHQNETPVQNNDVVESSGVPRQMPIQSALTGPPSESGQILEDIDTSASQLPSEWTTSGCPETPPIDDDWIREYLGNTS